MPNNEPSSPVTQNSTREHLPPTHQELADAVSRAYDAAADVAELLDKSHLDQTARGFERVALKRLSTSLGMHAYWYRHALFCLLEDLPEPTEARRHAEAPASPVDPASASDDIPF